MTTKALTVQQKAISLREDLFKRKDVFADAMTKTMDVERLLRIVFSTAMKNPKILDCTKESIFGAVMMCAQLGVEPILGRSYLIPYNNNKLVNGKWQKILECQFQLGYQGLIDLARRSGTISDVYGFNVYEEDEFDISYGTDRYIRHKPWYMSPEKRKTGKPGEIIGAYAVWQLKDGTMHPEFMPISDIHKRRDASQTWQNAVRNKREDTPWHLWEEDMNLKTVLKHSSKMVPASIEFMRAVDMDNISESGHTMTLDGILAGGGGATGMDFAALTAGQEEDTASLENPEDSFADLLKESGVNIDHMKAFVEMAMESFGSAEHDVMRGALETPEAFLKSFKDWEAESYPSADTSTTAATAPTIQDEIGGLKSPGLIAWEKKYHDDIDGLSPEDSKFFLDKWKRVIGKDYYEEGQPGFVSKDDNEPTQQQAQSEVAEEQEEEAKQRPQGNGNGGSKIALAFKQAMETYRDNEEEGIGRPAFVRILMLKGFKEIEDVPKDRYQEMFDAMEEERHRQAMERSN